MTDKICLAFHDTVLALPEKQLRIAPFCAEAQQLLGGLLLDWRDTLSCCEYLKKLVSGKGVDSKLDPQPALDATPSGIIAVATLAQAPFLRALGALLQAAQLNPKRLKLGPVKKAERVAAKVGSTPGMCFDLNRATIFCKSERSFWR